jgi:flagellar motor switch protein FliN/FliY
MADSPLPALIAHPAASLSLDHTYLQVWAESLANVLGQIAGAPFDMECQETAPADASPPTESDLQIIVLSSGSLRGELSFALPQGAARGLAQFFLGEAQDATADFKPDYREAIEELMRQVAGHAATAMKPRWGEVQLRVETGPPPTWSPGASGWLNSIPGAPSRLCVEWKLSVALHAALLAAQPASEPSSASSSSPSGLTGPGPESKFDRFMDVELGVTLRFGSRRMLLREILELSAGAVVELDRQVQEPVDLLLDGKLIARGEVVVVDGNYGLRVIDVISPALAELR